MRRDDSDRKNVILASKARTCSSVLLALVWIGVAQPAEAQQTNRISTALNPPFQGNGPSIHVSAPAGGHQLSVFQSVASNLVSGDTNGVSDIFLSDGSGLTRVNLSSSGTQANAPSFDPCVSADGRYVTFDSAASNLVTGDGNGRHDVFVRDRSTGQTTRVSVSSAGTEGDNDSVSPAITADGRHIVFTSAASNLVAGDANGASDVFLHDRQTGQTSRLSVSSTGAEGNLASSQGTISSDGRFAAFTSSASNLTPADTNGSPDVFARDIQLGQTIRVSVSSTGTEGNGASTNPSLSADGRFVAFQSDAPDLVAGDTNLTTDVFVRHVQVAQTTLVSVSTAGVQGNGSSARPSIDGIGLTIAFESLASNLVASDTNNASDVFLRDTRGSTLLVSQTSAGTLANGPSRAPQVTRVGDFVFFESDATNLDPITPDANGLTDIFVRATGGILCGYRAHPADATVVAGSPTTLSARIGVSPGFSHVTWCRITLNPFTGLYDVEALGSGNVTQPQMGEIFTVLQLIPRLEDAEAWFATVVLDFGCPCGCWNCTNPYTAIDGYAECVSRWARLTVVAPQPASWANPNGGSLDDPQNWSPPVVPGPSTDVSFTLPGTYTVSGNPASYRSLRVLGGTVTIANTALTIGTNLTTAGSAPARFTNCTIHVGGPAIFEAGTGYAQGSFDLTNTGITIWSPDGQSPFSGALGFGGTVQMNGSYISVIPCSDCKFGGARVNISGVMTNQSYVEGQQVSAGLVIEGGSTLYCDSSVSGGVTVRGTGSKLIVGGNRGLWDLYPLGALENGSYVVEDGGLLDTPWMSGQGVCRGAGSKLRLRDSGDDPYYPPAQHLPLDLIDGGEFDGYPGQAEIRVAGGGVIRSRWPGGVLGGCRVSGAGWVEAPSGPFTGIEVSPGGDGAAPYGILELRGDVDQPRVILDLGGDAPGVDRDRIVVTGAVDGGALYLRFPGSDVPSVGASFPGLVASGGGFSTPFAGTFNLETPLPGRFLRFEYGSLADLGAAVSVTVDPLNFGVDLQNPQPFEATGLPTSAAVGDLDRDGQGIGGNNLADIAMTIPGDSPADLGFVVALFSHFDPNTSVFSFTSAQMPVGREPSAVAIANLSHPPASQQATINDLAVANKGDDTITVLANDGSGSFSPGGLVATGLSAPVSLIAADFNQDERVDLAAANEDDHSLSVFVNSGVTDVSFVLGPRILFAEGSRPTSTGEGDIEGDKDDDIVVALLHQSPPGNNLEPAVAVLANTTLGSGATPTFGLPVFHTIDGPPKQVMLADLHNAPPGSGLSTPEIVTANANGTLSILPNLGTGAFSGSLPCPVGTQASSVVAIDLDNDLDRELAVVATPDGATQSTVRVLRNDVAGGAQLNFAAPVNYESENQPVFVLRGDLNGDLAPDLVAITAQLVEDANADSLRAGFLRGQSRRSGVADGPTVSDVLSVQLNATSFLPGDTNNDHVVDFLDLNNVLSDYGGPPATMYRADLNRDGVVDFLDLNILLSYYGSPR